MDDDNENSYKTPVKPFEDFQNQNTNGESESTGGNTDRSCASMWNRISQTYDFESVETSIHDFLDSMNLNQLNIKNYQEIKN